MDTPADISQNLSKYQIMDGSDSSGENKYVTQEE
jgi:hypothetical protein